MQIKPISHLMNPAQNDIELKDGSIVSERQISCVMVVLQSLSANPVELSRLKFISENRDLDESCSALFSSLEQDLKSTSERRLHSEEDQQRVHLKIHTAVKKIILNAVQINNTDVTIVDPRRLLENISSKT